MQDFTKLIVWRTRLACRQLRWRIAPAIAHNLTINIYKLTYSMPSQEKAKALRSSRRKTTICAYALRLISQIRRSCVSIESKQPAKQASVARRDLGAYALRRRLRKRQR